MWEKLGYTIFNFSIFSVASLYFSTLLFCNQNINNKYHIPIIFHLKLRYSFFYVTLDIFQPLQSLADAKYYILSSGRWQFRISAYHCITKTLKWFLLLLCQVRDINSQIRGNCLTQNRRNSISCTVRTSRQRSCNQRVGGLIDVTLPNTLGVGKRRDLAHLDYPGLLDMTLQCYAHQARPYEVIDLKKTHY